MALCTKTRPRLRRRRQSLWRLDENHRGTPPQIEFTDGPAADQRSGEDEYYFLSPGYEDDAEPDHGAGIYDADGELVWMQPADREGEDNFFYVRVQSYLGQPVLTYYRGPNYAWGNAEITVLDETYDRIANVTTGGEVGPQRADFHYTTITDRWTMLLISYYPTPMDLSAVGGPADGWVLDGRIQEIDIATGVVVFGWAAADHVPAEHTSQEIAADDHAMGTEGAPFDWFHLNSITEDDDGNLILLARNTHAIYKLDKQTGALVWTLGDRASDFQMGEGTDFAWQHDTQRAYDGAVTLLDNHVYLDDAESGDSRGLRLALDDEAMTAGVAQQYDPPLQRPAGSLANVQEIDVGTVVIGWGQEPYFSEYTHDGELILDASHGGDGSNRAYRFPWDGRPTTEPDVAVQDGSVFVSWNGATEVAQWRVVASDDEGSAEPVETEGRDGFETEIPLEQDAAYVAVEALDENGQVLATGTPQD
ncbi:arylsulfotransferase family protein [Kocuria palustris]|uniref:arylsulfotransferase family protein n=1 Tax=Kocuria palustris TaxID=71999 RepID=UPI0024688D81|nr:arylsulfotransferase family protein [Kocuria palustris]MDH5150557.1 arylsulfotransferase family protein [Kocuria palustris]